MRGPVLIMTGIAVVVGGATVIGGRYYMERANARPQPVVVAAPAPPPVQTAKVVVAAQPLRFGMELSSQQLKEVSWPVDAVPPGAASSVAEFLKGPERRVVIAAMEPNEPVLPIKVTGPGQRATLSAILAPGMTAVTFTLSEAHGVTGLAMPGDRVNVMFTRKGGESDLFTDVLLPNVRLLAVDQVMNQRHDGALPVRNVTIEVMPQDAKRVALASTIGTLSLMLRRVGEENAGVSGKIGFRDLFVENGDVNITANHGPRAATVKVTRNGKAEEYSVPAEKTR
jgi:pilus assembly protein CpaB